MSRLDRFLLSEGFIEKGSITNQWVGDRDISDHCPIWLESSNSNWGPKPFKFNNCWLDHPDFIPFVKTTWEQMDICGKKAFIVKEKMKKLKEALKAWNREIFGLMDLNIEKTVKDMNEVEEMLANGDSHPIFINSKELSKNFWEQLHFKESLLQQKSRTKWIKEGDSNTRYFHASIKGRRRRNNVVKIKKGTEWLQGVAAIKSEAIDHYSKLFSEEWLQRPFLQGINFKTLSADDNAFLLEPFAEDEVRETIWSCDGNKSPGPDGFNINFLKACWSIVKSDVLDFLREFHENAHLPKALTSSFLTLIPKKDHPQDFYDYRPICLIGSLYKILSKILANRLKKVLGKIISNCQSAFLPRRQILDGVVVLNEIIDLANKRKDGCLLFKVDFERAYDTVSWRFLERMMIKMGFTEGWLKWMRACIFDSSMSVLINGSPTVDFKVERGLRQGDPLSPFLFLIVAEGLTGLMNRAVHIGKFKGYQINKNLQFQILQFADDTILLGEGTWENVQTIKTVLRSFELVSGIPIGANPRRRETWKPVVDAMSKRLCSWNSHHLSYGGRITLINSVLSSLPLYFFSFFKAPSCILKQLVRIQRNFLWGGGIEDKKLCWVKWDQICRPKDQGGYGHLPTQLFGDVPKPIGNKFSIWWKDIIGTNGGEEVDWFKSNVRACVGNGENIGFWNYKWLGNNTFRELYPSLYVKEENPNVMIAERLGGSGETFLRLWQWSTHLSASEEQQVNELSELLKLSIPMCWKLSNDYGTMKYRLKYWFLDGGCYWKGYPRG
ncbi:hypothetical protein TSUD_62250 [Trifolium subterraneum]|uniref:Reverse transcriptase domain-containing protein n=1 Tax=Trifolium subterraneum TaxID=3900 RepID=A0A2Z6N3J3_TRISU|nr:hypothetical protein TSUD_62250 [Trifolium subterraneum]